MNTRIVNSISVFSGLIVCAALISGCGGASTFDSQTADQPPALTTESEVAQATVTKRTPVLQTSIDENIAESSAESIPERLPYYEEASFTPKWYDDPSSIPAYFHALPDLELTDQTGRTITEKDLEGKLFVTNFFFATCPGICPSTIGNLLHLQETFKAYDDVLLLSHSVTPEKDTVEALRVFADEKGVDDSRWHLLTGDRNEIYNLGKDFYFADEDLGEQQDPADSASNFIHTESFFLIDRQGRIRGVYNGMNKAAVNQLVEDVAVLHALG